MKKRICLLLAMGMLLLSAGLAENVGFSSENGSGSGKGGTFEAEAAGEKTAPTEVPVAAGDCLWRLAGDGIACLDAQTGSRKAEIPLRALCAEKPEHLDLIPSGGGVLLCAVTDALSADCRVTLRKLTLSDGGIVPGEAADRTEALGFLFNGETKWLEADLIGGADGVLISAMDPTFVYHLYGFDPETAEVRELGTQPFSRLDAILPDGGDFLLAGPSAEQDGAQELTRLDFRTGARETLAVLETGSESQPSGYALEEAGRTLYYLLDGIGYRAELNADPPVPAPFAAAPEQAARTRYGAAAGGCYILPETDGELWIQPTARNAGAETFHILDLAGTNLTELLPAFHAAHGDYLAVISEEEDPERALDAMLGASGEADACIVSLGSELYRTLSARGRLGDMSGSAALTAAAERFPERISERILQEGRLTAFPVALQSRVMLLNVPVMTELTGLSREEIPTDWMGFLSLLERIGEKGWPEDGSVSLYEPGIPGGMMRMLFRMFALEDALLWADQDALRREALPERLTPVLQKLENMDWTRLGLTEEGEEEEDWTEAEKPRLLDWTSPEIAVMNIPSGMECWPLSLAEGEAALIPQDVAVLILNPGSPCVEGVLRLAETFWEELNIVTRMELDASLTDSVPNETYAEDLASMQSMADMYQEEIAEADSEEEAGELRAELRDLQAYMEQYRQNAAWLVSPESVAWYRALESRMAVPRSQLMERADGEALFAQLENGMLDAEQFARRLADLLRAPEEAP